MATDEYIRGVVLACFLVIVGISTSCATSVESQKPKNYGVIGLDVLVAELRDNAAAAKKKYLNTNWVVKGVVWKIDSDGEYLVLADHKKYGSGKITCLLDGGNKNQESFVLSLRTGQPIRVFGTFSAIDDDTGYVMIVDKFELSN